MPQGGRVWHRCVLVKSIAHVQIAIRYIVNLLNFAQSTSSATTGTEEGGL